ncbi:hypothetical protein KUM39_18345 [Streptomyces sp. J2-1]|uniref:hypothetical protein n=1 Tax=Streptomyces corallincola TaxID=2851888 RepID=UPI001C392BA2|nr:hypothetical protein [Streptomyces corallincola]MBV2356315.1 hypothetical protein [Streptomyces corallincola]
MSEIPEELLVRERLAEEERARLAGLTGAAYDAQARRWREAVGAYREAVTAYAERTGADGHHVERAVQRAVRCAQEDPCVE